MLSSTYYKPTDQPTDGRTDCIHSNESRRTHTRSGNDQLSLFRYLHKLEGYVEAAKFLYKNFADWTERRNRWGVRYVRSSSVALLRR